MSDASMSGQSGAPAPASAATVRERPFASGSSVASREAAGFDRIDRHVWALIASAMVPLLLLHPAMALWFVVPMAVLLAAGRRRTPITSRQATWLASATGAACLLHYLVVRESVLAFTAFFVALGVLSLFQGRGRHSLRRVYLLFFFVLLVVATRTLELEFLFFLLMFCASLVICWLRDTHPDAVRPGIRLRYILGAYGFVLASALIAVPLFFLLPRAPFVIFNAIDLPSVTGFGDEVTLGEMASIKKSDKLFMRVFASEARRWRGRVLVDYDGKKWTASPGQGPILTSDGAGPVRIPGSGEEPLEGMFLQEFVVEPYLSRALFAAADAAAVEMSGFPVVMRAGNELSRGGEIRFQKVTYRVWSRNVETPAAKLRAASGPINVTYSMRPYLEMPAGLDRLRALSDRIAGRLPSWYEKARAIEAYLLDNYTYTLDLPGVSGDPVEAFLFETRRGHCEYFASAMTLLLRAQGVPARVVTGFAFGEHNAYGNYQTVRERDAHAWTEAFMPGVGWVEFDATPASAEEQEMGLLARLGLANLEWWLQARAWIDSMDMAWQRDVISYSADTQKRILAALVENFDALHAELLNRYYAARVWVRQRKPQLVLLLAAMLTASLLGGQKRARALLGWLLARLEPWLPRRRRRPAPLQIAPFYGRFVDLLEGSGLERRPEWTPIEYADRVKVVRPELAKPVDTITGLYCRIVFAGEPADEATRLEAVAVLAALRETLRKKRT